MSKRLRFRCAGNMTARKEGGGAHGQKNAGTGFRTGIPAAASAGGVQNTKFPGMSTAHVWFFSSTRLRLVALPAASVSMPIMASPPEGLQVT